MSETLPFSIVIPTPFRNSSDGSVQVRIFDIRSDNDAESLLQALKGEYEERSLRRENRRLVVELVQENTMSIEQIM